MRVRVGETLGQSGQHLHADSRRRHQHRPELGGRAPATPCPSPRPRPQCGRHLEECQLAEVPPRRELGDSASPSRHEAMPESTRKNSRPTEPCAVRSSPLSTLTGVPSCAMDRRSLCEQPEKSGTAFNSSICCFGTDAACGHMYWAGPVGNASRSVSSPSPERWVLRQACLGALTRLPAGAGAARISGSSRGVRGNSSTMRISSGHFWRVGPASWRCAAGPRGRGRAPGCMRKNAQPCSPRRSSGAATTATSATPFMWARSCSTSVR